MARPPRNDTQQDKETIHLFQAYLWLQTRQNLEVLTGRKIVILRTSMGEGSARIHLSTSSNGSDNLRSAPPDGRHIATFKTASKRSGIDDRESLTDHEFGLPLPLGALIQIGVAHKHSFGVRRNGVECAVSDGRAGVAKLACIG